MKKRKPLQTDLFITPTPQTEWPALQRAKVLALIETLLAEANGADVEQEEGAPHQPGVDHDEDHD
jgi:hypothetical protein